MSLVNKYIDSNNFLTAISVYNEEALLTLATDGYYQNNGTYRRQLNGLLGPSVLCESCAPIYSSLSLCFSSISEDALCCGNSTSVTVFVAGAGVTTLDSVTGLLYTTSALTTQATPGYYSDDAGITCSSSTLVSLNTSIGNLTGNCLAPQSTPLYFEVISPATNQSPLIGDDVFSDTSGTLLNNTTTTMYYMTSLTAYGVALGKVVSIAQCTTPPTP